MSARSKARKRALDLIYASEMRNRSAIEALEEQTEAGRSTTTPSSSCTASTSTANGSTR